MEDLLKKMKKEKKSRSQANFGLKYNVNIIYIITFLKMSYSVDKL